MPSNEAPTHDPQQPANTTSPRPTLKLKTAPRQPPREQPAPQAAPPKNKSKSNPDARWSDDYKRQMQADMGRLGR
jgi:hypothetical protein